LLSKLYIYNNVTLVGHCNGLECYNHGYSRYYKFNIDYLGFYYLFLGLTSGLTELRLGSRTGRAAFRLEFLFLFLKIFRLKWLNGDFDFDFDCIICVIDVYCNKSNKCVRRVRRVGRVRAGSRVLRGLRRRQAYEAHEATYESTNVK
jgi:hypothetical protein